MAPALRHSAAVCPHAGVADLDFTSVVQRSPSPENRIAVRILDLTSAGTRLAAENGLPWISKISAKSACISTVDIDVDG